MERTNAIRVGLLSYENTPRESFHLKATKQVLYILWICSTLKCLMDQSFEFLVSAVLSFSSSRNFGNFGKKINSDIMDAMTAKVDDQVSCEAKVTENIDH